MAINKIIINNEVKLDLTQDTVTPADVKKGKIFHGADGEIIEGSFAFQGTTAEANDVRIGKKFYNAFGELDEGVLEPTADVDYDYTLKEFIDGMEVISIDDQNNPTWAGVRKIPDCFYTGSINSKLTTVEMQDIEYIGDGAFAGAGKLENVITPNAKCIGMHAFADSVFDYSIDGTDGVNYTGDPVPLTGTVDFSEVQYISGNAFSNSKIEHLQLPACKAIGLPPMSYMQNEADKVNMSLAAYIEDRVSSASSGPGATFQNCSSLKSINLDSLEFCVDSEFSGCVELEEVNMPNLLRVPFSPFYSYNGKLAALKKVSCPKCTYFGPPGFADCINLETVELPKVTQLVPYMFRGCLKLKEIVLPEVIEGMSTSSYSDVQYWGPNEEQSSAAQYTTSIERLILPKYTGKVEIAFGQSLGCSGPLHELDLRSVTKIDTFAFDGFANLETVHLDACENLDGYTFECCPKLQEINLPSIKIMRAGDFSCCNLLRRVELGENLVQIGSPFPQCPNLTTVIIHANQVPTLTDAITTTGPTGPGTMSFPSQTNIYVKDELVDEYKAADGWITFASQIKPLSELQEA